MRAQFHWIFIRLFLAAIKPVRRTTYSHAHAHTLKKNDCANEIKINGKIKTKLKRETIEHVTRIFASSLTHRPGFTCFLLGAFNFCPMHCNKFVNRRRYCACFILVHNSTIPVSFVIKSRDYVLP